ncbi:MAG: hypothetical protein GY805_04600 [Chloroflexi bacterium]|nr:hypothetical protein [Chloroflexota bacterium]
MSKDEKLEVDIITETENFAVWRSPDENGFIYHVELGSITLHLASDEWEELLDLLGDLDE